MFFFFFKCFVLKNICRYFAIVALGHEFLPCQPPVWAKFYIHKFRNMSVRDFYFLMFASPISHYTLLEKFWQISLCVTDNAIAKL